MSRYVNGLRLNIQDELSILHISEIEDAYQYAMKKEDKLKRRQVIPRIRDKSNGYKHEKKLVIEEELDQRIH